MVKIIEASAKGKVLPRCNSSTVVPQAQGNNEETIERTTIARSLQTFIAHSGAQIVIWSAVAGELIVSVVRIGQMLIEQQIYQISWIPP